MFAHLGCRLIAVIRAVREGVARRRRIARAIAELERYDEALLRDVGIPRDRIRAAVEGAAAQEEAGRDRRPSAEVIRFPGYLARASAAPTGPEVCRALGCCEVA